MSGPADGFYVTGGAMGPEAASYIPRRADDELYEALTRGELCSVLTPSQSGKSSLMTRTAVRLGAEGVAVARIDLTGIGENLDAEQWYLSLLLKIGRDLGLRDELRAFWRENKSIGPMLRWMEAIREVVLVRRPGRVVIFIDEIGVVTKLPFSTDEFFAAIRACYHGRPEDPELERLTFCLLGVATPSELLRDTHTTAFNVGRRIHLDDFKADEAAKLARGLGRPERLARRLLKRILHWTGGHPYLTQRLCRAVAEDPGIRSPSGVNRACRRLFLAPESRGQDPNLKEVERQVLKRGEDVVEVIDAFRRVRRAPLAWVGDDERKPALAVLRTSGITRVVAGCLLVRNRIYARVFDNEWMRANMPDAEVRRQNRAFRRGFGLAALVTSILVGTILFQNLKLRVLHQQSAQNEQMARRNELKAQRESARLIAVIEMIQALEQRFIRDLELEAGKDPILRYVPPTLQKRVMAIGLSKAIEYAVDVVRQYPDVQPMRSGLAQLYHDLGKIQIELQRKDEALTNLVRSVEDQLVVHNREPHVLRYRRELSLYYRDLAQAQREAGQSAASIACTLSRARLWPHDPRELDDVVHELAECASPEKPLPTEDFIARALLVLQRAVAGGYDDLDTLKSFLVLDYLRGCDDFRSLLDTLAHRRSARPSSSSPRARSSWHRGSRLLDALALGTGPWLRREVRSWRGDVTIREGRVRRSPVPSSGSSAGQVRPVPPTPRSPMSEPIDYKAAGVDLDTYAETMALLPPLLKRTFTPRVIEWKDGFAGLFRLDANIGLLSRTYRDPVLVASTDGVGTKLKLAFATGRHATVGIDLVAMSVNDCLCAGAEPLLFLDYVAMSRDDPGLTRQIVQGISDGCVDAECALLGGETAILPEFYRGGEYDLAGFCLGVVERKHLLKGHEIRPGDKVIGLASSGLHSNGYSLARKVAFEHAGLGPDSFVESLGRTVADEFLVPTRIYVRAVKTVYRHYRVKRIVHGIAHITGGGLIENPPRILPQGCAIALRRDSWEVPAVFPWLRRLGGISDAEMYRVFNMGIGLVLIVADFYAEAITRYLTTEVKVPAWIIGSVVDGQGEPSVHWA